MFLIRRGDLCQTQATNPERIRMNDVRQARDKAQYVRQQKGHSFILHWFVIGIFTLWILPIYYSVSPNHYWHA